MSTPERFLCLCSGAVSRSVAMARALKYEAGKDALAAAVDKNSPETLKLLFGWADKIVAMHQDFAGRVPEAYRDKLVVVDVGEDRWNNPMQADLYGACCRVVQDWKTRQFDFPAPYSISLRSTPGVNPSLPDGPCPTCRAHLPGRSLRGTL